MPGGLGRPSEESYSFVFRCSTILSFSNIFRIYPLLQNLPYRALWGPMGAYGALQGPILARDWDQAWPVTGPGPGPGRDPGLARDVTRAWP